MANRARLETLYTENIRPQLMQELGITNIMQAPKLSKIVINVGAKEAVADSRILKTITDIINKITGQQSVKTVAKKSIASFKIREGMPIGVMVTLRGKTMYNFLDRFINLALPKVKDFQGLSQKLDGRGSYNVGIKDWSIFPEAESKVETHVGGMNITIHTTAENDQFGYALLKSFGMPFKQKQK